MYEDLDGSLWLGTSLGVVRHQNGAHTLYTTKDGLAGDDTKVIIPDRRGGVANGLWLGSYGGLTHYENGQFKSWAEKDGLPGRTVRALKQDDDGTLWIGTYDGGLGRFKDGKFTTYTKNDGLFDNGVFQILEDDFGWFWMSCNRGIYRVRKQELQDFAEGKINTITSISYGKGDGMLNVEGNGGRWPAGIKARDGKLWFPTMGGVVVVDPANIKINSQPPPVVIEAMKINRKAVPLEIWQAAISTANTAIEIGPEEGNFEIEYTALSFINPENLRFKYKLEGLDPDWVDAGTRRTAYFSHVAPGGYTFRVIAANSDGVWNMEGKSFRIVVVPPFYRRWWFLLLSGLALIGLATFAYQYRIRQMRRVQLAQQHFSQELIESQEAERKRIAAELHDSLGQNLIVIKNWAMIGLTQTPADAPVREQLDVISTTAVQSLNDVRAIIHNLRPYQLETIGLGNTLRFMIEQVGAASGIAFTGEIATLDHRFTPDDEVLLYRLVQECVSNIVKHSAASAANVSLRLEQGQLQITISDNGRGFPLSAPPVNAQSSGFGLKGLEERVRILRGEHKITTVPGKGVTHYFVIPVPSTEASRKDSSHEG
jgi:signal transduction histidine kinase